MTLDLSSSENCRGLALFRLHKHAVTVHPPLLRLFLHLPLFNILISHLYLPFLYTQPTNQRDFTITSLPSPHAFLPAQMLMMRENMTLNRTAARGHTRRRAQRQKLNPNTNTHKQTNFDIQIRLCVTQTFAYAHHNGLHRAEEEWAPTTADHTIHGDTTKECQIREFYWPACKNYKHLFNVFAYSNRSCTNKVYRVMGGR